MIVGKAEGEIGKMRREKKGGWRRGYDIIYTTFIFSLH